MLQLEEFMDIQKLYHDSVTITKIARRVARDRKTVRKYLEQEPRPYQPEPQSWKVDAYRAHLRERWKQGVQNGSRLFREIRKRGYGGVATRR